MKGRSTLFLLIGILALGTFIWIQESWRARVPSKEYLRTKLFDLDAETLVSMQFKLTNTVIKCVKEGGVWVAGDPNEGMGRADVALILRMVAGLNAMGKGTTITAQQLDIRGLDAAEYGFDQPNIEITSVDNSGRRTWLVGRKAPLGGMVYVRESTSDDIYTVPDQLLSIIPTKPDQLRDLVLFSGEAIGVRRVEIRGQEGFIQLVKDSQSGWRIQQPLSALADPREVNAYIESLFSLRVEKFVADNVSDFSIYGLQGETRQIALEGADGTARMLVLGDEIPDREGDVYARRADDTSVFAIKADALDLLRVQVAHFRDVRVLPVALEEITSISVARGSEQLVLEVDPSKGWKISTPMIWAADPIAVTELAEIWEDAVIIQHDVATNNVAAEWVFEFASTESGETNRLEVLPTLGKKDGLLIRRNGELGLFQINLPLVPDSAIDPLVYKDKQIWKMDRNEIQKVSVVHSGQERQSIERGEAGGFSPAETNGNVRVDLISTGRILNQLELIETHEYITYNPRELEIYGLSDPALELHVGLAGTNELGRVLWVGRETPEGFYSMVKGRDVVFYLDSSTINILSDNLLFEPDPVTPNGE